MPHQTLNHLHKSNILNQNEYDAGLKLIQLSQLSKKHIHTKSFLPNHKSEKNYKLCNMILNDSNYPQILLDLTSQKITYLSYAEIRALKAALNETYYYLKKRNIR